MRGRGSSFVWTDFEEDILIQAVEEAGAIKRGLENAADLLGTTFYICRNRWYKYTQFKAAEKEKEQGETTPVVYEGEVVQEPRDKVDDLKDTLEDFLGNLSDLVDENKSLSEVNAELIRDNRRLAEENKELKEAYDYILKVIDKARRLCLEDDDRPAKVKYTIKDGAVEFTA